jgi:hypothetical protein
MGCKENVAVLKQVFCKSTHVAMGQRERMWNFTAHFMQFYPFCHGRERNCCSFKANSLMTYAMLI